MSGYPEKNLTKMEDYSAFIDIQHYRVGYGHLNSKTNRSLIHLVCDSIGYPGAFLVVQLQLGY